MKHLIPITFLLISCAEISFAQQINPVTNNIKNYSEIKKIEKQKNKLIEKQSAFKSLVVLTDSTNSNGITDTISKLEDEIKKTESILAELREDKALVVFSASSSLNSSEELKNYSGSTRVFANLQITDPLTITMAYNLAAVKPESIPSDSIDLIALMFPESGNTGFTVGASFEFPIGKDEKKKKEISHSIFALGEYSFKQTKFNSTTIDSTGNEVEDGSKEFSALNYNLGVKYQYCYKPKNNEDNAVYFGASVYYNFFNIPNEDAENFEIAIKDSFDEKSNISSIGAKFTLQYKGYTLFGDFRNNFTPKNFSNENAFKGFVYNVGTMISTEVFKL